MYIHISPILDAIYCQIAILFSKFLWEKIWYLLFIVLLANSAILHVGITLLGEAESFCELF